MLDLYRWQREQALASERMEWRNRHASMMEKNDTREQAPMRERLAGTLHTLAFHLAPNANWNREVAGKPAA